MTNICYAIIARDDHDKKLTVVGTGREARTSHGKVVPSFHKFCLSILALHPAAVLLEMVSWQPGVDVERAPVLLAVKRTELAGNLAYSFPDQSDS